MSNEKEENKFRTFAEANALDSSENGLEQNNFINPLISKHLVMHNIQRTSTGERDADQTSSVFFRLSYLKTFLDRVDNWADTPENYGIRIYFGKYEMQSQVIEQYFNDNNIDSRFEDRPTAVIQLMSNDNIRFIPGRDGQLVTANLGQLCPPRCPTDRREDDIFWDPNI